ININKSKEQTKSGCIIYLENDELRNKIIELENKLNGEIDNREELVIELKGLREEQLLKAQDIKKKVEETLIGEFIIDTDMKYVVKKDESQSSETIDRIRASPVMDG